MSCRGVLTTGGELGIKTQSRSVLSILLAYPACKSFSVRPESRSNNGSAETYLGLSVHGTCTLAAPAGLDYLTTSYSLSGPLGFSWPPVWWLHCCGRQVQLQHTRYARGPSVRLHSWLPASLPVSREYWKGPLSLYPLSWQGEGRKAGMCGECGSGTM